MVRQFVLASFMGICGVAQAGFYLSMASAHDQLSHQVKFEGDSADAESGKSQSLDVLMGAGFEFRPGSSFSMPLGIEMAYKKAKTVATHVIKDQPYTDVFGAVVARPTYRFGWLGAYGLLGYGNVNFSQMTTEGASEQVATKIENQLVVPFYGLGAQVKLDRDLTAYAEYIAANTKIEDLLGLDTTINEKRPAEMNLQEGRYMVGIRYIL
jgi:hypothetical protein